MSRRQLLELLAVLPFVKTATATPITLDQTINAWELPAGVNWYEIGGQKLYPIIDANGVRTGESVAYLWTGDKALLQAKFDVGKLNRADPETGIALTFPQAKWITTCIEGGPLGRGGPKGAILAIEFKKDESVESARKRLKLAIETVSHYA